MNRVFSSLKFILKPAVNLLLAYLLMEITRLVFLWANHGLFNLSWHSFALVSRGGLLFDTAAILYLNCLWLALVCFPCHLKERNWFWMLEKCVFVVCNSLGLLANLCDTVFFPYRQHRTTAAIFSEFGGEDNLAKIILTETISHWYLVLLFALMVWVMWRCYLPVKGPRHPKSYAQYYLSRTVALALYVAFFIFGVRGCTFSKVTRPISVGYAQRFATDPIDVDLVLNTPFAILRTIGGSPAPAPEFFSETELTEIYSPIHNPTPADSLFGVLRGHNVVVIALESFSQEFVGALNADVPGFKGYTPFLDSLISQSVRFQHTFSNSGFSIDAMPALLASTPRMRRPFVVSPYSLNHVSGLGEILADEGYNTAFFHGADNESLGIQAFVRQAGFKNYFGMDEYVADPSTRGMDDFDGTWGIWDGPFLQYFSRKLNQMSQPFVAGLFTLSSHHPFKIPSELADTFPPEGPLEICRNIRYTDDALRRFFQTASTQPWFANTLFVISADHTFLHKPALDHYNNEMGRMKIPIFIFDPSHTLTPATLPGSMQQIDVLPSVLSLLGYDKPFFAFGRNVFADETPWAIRWNHIPQIVMGDYVLQMDPETWQPTAMFNYVTDCTLSRNLLNTGHPAQPQLEAKLRAIIQTYSTTQRQNHVHL